MSDTNAKSLDALSHDAIVRALFEKYESIYAVDTKTWAYQCFYESDSYNSLKLRDRGDDFFASLEQNINRTVYYEDREHVKKMLSKNALISAFEKDSFYSFVYRLVINGKPLYHKFRATTDIINERKYLLIGIRNVDTAFRQDKAQAEELSSMHSKEINHLEAILASAEGYLEANLSKDIVLDLSPYTLSSSIPNDLRVHEEGRTLSYSTFGKLYIEKLVVENKEKYIKISDRNYLINCFEQGSKRASVSFSMRDDDGKINPCKVVFYLYQDASSDDIMAFCVIYDLTEQQRRDKEIEELEHKLQMSRLKNFTSQMQPHFLYNALGSIQEIILENPKYASELLGYFTVHLRSCIRAMSNDAPIPFEQELSNIKAYTNIEKMRFGDKLKIQYDIKIKNFLIVPLSVQPIVENAIRHGIYKRGAEGGTVVIKTEKIEGGVIITIEDNGVGFDVDFYKKSAELNDIDSTGLKNIIFRLDKVMNASVDIDSKVGLGTKVVITVPEGIKSDESNYS